MRVPPILYFVAACLMAACGDDTSPSPDAGGPEGGTDGPGDAGGDPAFVASCVYTNTFSSTPECREYRGAGWTTQSVAIDCEDAFFGNAGTPGEGACELADVIGRCVVGDPMASGYAIVSTGAPSACGAAQAACEAFAGGTFEAAEVCNSCTPSEEIGQPFVPAFEDCRAPLAGEPGGQSDGEVCTWTIISGSTEPGRRYADYADCDVVRTQRPYYAEASGVESDPADPRLSDSAYMAELAWLTEQAEASACTCCHTSSDTPDGAAIWDTEAGPLWIDTVSDEALAMLGGYTDSAAFGFLPTGDNNGFDRSGTGLPTTDVARLRAFVELELARRDLSAEEAAALPPFAPFFRELIDFDPAECAEGIGMDADGTLRWFGGGARYVYVLEADAQAPGVPPNWDLPTGTLWSIFVPPDQPQMGCGMEYGALPAGAIQRVPDAGDAPELESGRQYFLYVLRDIALPIARCLFTAP